MIYLSHLERIVRYLRLAREELEQANELAEQQKQQALADAEYHLACYGPIVPERSI